MTFTQTPPLPALPHPHDLLQVRFTLSSQRPFLTQGHLLLFFQAFPTYLRVCSLVSRPLLLSWTFLPNTRIAVLLPPGVTSVAQSAPFLEGWKGTDPQDPWGSGEYG